MEGEILPMHTHPPHGAHLTIVLSGSIRAYGPNFSETLYKGNFYDFADDQQTHEFVALEDNTRIVNIPKYLHKYDYVEEETLTEHNKKLFEAEQEQFRKDQEEHIRQLAEEDRVKQNGNFNYTG